MTNLRLSPSDDISAAVDDIDGPVTIVLAPGVYRQKIKVSNPVVSIVGAGQNRTKIVYGDFARKQHPDGREYNTFRTYTLCVTGDDVSIRDLTVENDAGAPETNGQSIALSVQSARFYGENLRVASTQDTLFLAPFPDDLVTRYKGFIPDDELYREGTSIARFKNCEISGTVDFVFGGARALFDGCSFISLHDARSTGFVAAPSHPLAEDVGFIFRDCDFVAGTADDDSVFLARPWRDFGKCSFVDCRVGKHVRKELFDKWGDTERDGTARFSHSGVKPDTDARALKCAPWAKKMSPKERERCLSEADKITLVVPDRY